MLIAAKGLHAAMQSVMGCCMKLEQSAMLSTTLLVQQYINVEREHA